MFNPLNSSSYLSEVLPITNSEFWVPQGNSEDNNFLFDAVTLKLKQPKSGIGKALVYMGNNFNANNWELFNESINYFLSYMEQYFPSVYITAYYGDYIDFKNDTEQYKWLIKILLEDGYKPEDILLIGHSYGIKIAAHVLVELVKEDEKYKAIKFIGDTIYEPKNAAKITAKEQAALTETLLTQQPNSFIFHVGNETVVAKFLKGHINRVIPVTLNPDEIYTLPIFQELEPFDFIAAFLAEQPINLQFSTTFLDEILEETSDEQSVIYDLGSNSHKEFKPQNRMPVLAPLLILENINELLKELHEYALACAEHGRINGGPNYAYRPWGSMFRHKIWTVGELMDSTVQLMTYLSNFEADCTTLASYIEESKLHESGQLAKIVEHINQLIQEYKNIARVNKRILFKGLEAPEVTSKLNRDLADTTEYDVEETDLTEVTTEGSDWGFIKI